MSGTFVSDAPDGEFLAVTAGPAHTCALRLDRFAVCWGSSRLGQADAPQGKFAVG